MSSVDWFMDIPSMIHSRIVSEFSKSIKDKYDMKDTENFSSDEDSDTPPIFPFVSVDDLEPSEQGRDLDGVTVNGGIFAFQIDVYDNQSKGRAKEVMREVLRIMKSMRFEANVMPSFSKTGDMRRYTARFRRYIGSGDTL